MDCIRIDEIGGRGLERGQRTHGEDGCADIGRNPVDRILSGPAVDEDADNDEDAEGKENGHAVLGLAFVVWVSLLQLPVDDVHPLAADGCSEEQTKSDGDIVQTCDPGGFMIDMFEEDGKCAEYEVHEAESVGVVEG